MSPSLADKLKSLGVKVGTGEIRPQVEIPRKAARQPLEESLGGRWIESRRGPAFVVEQTYPLDYTHGNFPIRISAPLEGIAAWAGDPRIAGLAPEKLAFLDTETSGLSGGTGTYAFMVGVARYIDGGLHLAMFFMPAPEEEAALLEALADFLAPCEALVTFNGKSFDAPLLKTRYALQSIPCPFDDFAHIDLLPLARRLWRERLPSRALKALEVDILNAPRGPEEVPGYEIPYLYFDYLRSGDPSPLKGIFYHNGLDVVSMAALLNHTAALLNNPHEAELHGLDILALARLFADLRKWDDAARLYERALESGLPEASFADALKRYAILQRRRGDWETAVKLWERAAGEGHIYAHVELAKHAEHRQRDIPLALRWTETAMQLANAPALPDYIRAYWLAELEHRQARLEGKNEK
ncbi:MAG: ribonuclease H-like domain-containing protein [Anaerolineales bacterium]